MVEVLALCARRRQNGGIRNGRNVVAANRACQASRHGDRQHVACAKDGERNRNQDTERTPRGAGRKRNAERHHKEDGGHKHQQAGVAGANMVRDKAAQIEIFLRADARQRPGKGQNKDGRDHGLKAFGERFTELTKAQNAARHIHQEGKYQRCKRAEHQRIGCRTVGKGIDGVLACKAAAVVEHGQHAYGNQEQDRDEQVFDLAAADDNGRFLAVGVDLAAFAHLLVILVHREEINIGRRHPNEESQRQQGIQIKRDGLQKQRKAVDARVLGQRGRNRSRPRGDRRNDAHRRCGRIDDIRKLGAGDLLPVGDRAHDRANGQAVEVVIHKNQRAKCRSCKGRTAPGFDVPGSPFTVSARGARFGNERHQNAQHNQK